MGDFSDNDPVRDQARDAGEGSTARVQQKQPCFSPLQHVDGLVLSRPDYGP